MIIIALTDIHSRTKVITNLAGQLRSADLLLLYGLGGSLPCPGRTPHAYDEEDQVSPGFHVGSHVMAEITDQIIKKLEINHAR